jgi:hypothetical protein
MPSRSGLQRQLPGRPQPNIGAAWTPRDTEKGTRFEDDPCRPRDVVVTLHFLDSVKPPGALRKVTAAEVARGYPVAMSLRLYEPPIALM